VTTVALPDSWAAHSKANLHDLCMAGNSEIRLCCNVHSEQPKSGSGKLNSAPFNSVKASTKAGQGLTPAIKYGKFGPGTDQIQTGTHSGNQVQRYWLGHYFIT